MYANNEYGLYYDCPEAHYSVTQWSQDGYSSEGSSNSCIQHTSSSLHTMQDINPWIDQYEFSRNLYRVPQNPLSVKTEPLPWLNSQDIDAALTNTNLRNLSRMDRTHPEWSEHPPVIPKNSAYPTQQSDPDDAPVLNINVVDMGNDNYETVNYTNTVEPILKSNGSLKCPQCPRTFQKSSYLKQHFNAHHNGAKPFKCGQCGKRFSNNDKYQIHLSRHTAEREFECSECPRRFHHRSDLNRHVKEHVKMFSYTCDVCDKGFVRKDHYENHRMTHERKSEYRFRHVLRNVK